MLKNMGRERQSNKNEKTYKNKITCSKCKKKFKLDEYNTETEGKKTYFYCECKNVMEVK